MTWQHMPDGFENCSEFRENTQPPPPSDADGVLFPVSGDGTTGALKLNTIASKDADGWYGIGGYEYGDLGDTVPFGRTWPKAGGFSENTGTAWGFRDSVKTSGTEVARESQSWPTPVKRDWKDTGRQEELAKYAHKVRLPCVVAKRRMDAGKPGGSPLNPSWVEWLMGWPVGWTKMSEEGIAEEWGVHGRRAVAECVLYWAERGRE